MKDKSNREMLLGQEALHLRKENHTTSTGSLKFFFEKKGHTKIEDAPLLIATRASLEESNPSFADMSLSERTMSSTETSYSDMVISTETENNILINHSFLKKSLTSKSTAELSGLATYNISSYDIRLGAPLGEGASATVFQGEFRGDVVAIKSPNLNQTHVTKGRVTQKEIEAASECLLNEKLILEKIAKTPKDEESSENNIIKFFGVYYSIIAPNSSLSQINLVIEYANCGSLSHWIFKTPFPMEPNTYHGIAGNIALGLRFLHENVGILHCDIKPDNILIQKSKNNGEVTAKICDFGISIEKHVQEFNGTLSHLAPEVILGVEGHSEKSDMYSLGVVLWEMAARNSITTMIGDETNIINYAVAGVPLESHKDTPTNIAPLSNKCLMFQPEKRPTAREFVEGLSLIVSNNL